MARARDYRAEYRARVARAQARGYSGYGQERRARSVAKREGRPSPPPPSRTRQQVRNARARAGGWINDYQRRKAYRDTCQLQAYYDAYITDANRDEVVKAFSMLSTEGDGDYGPDSWHYYLFVELLDYLSAEEWETHYPNGVRTYGL